MTDTGVLLTREPVLDAQHLLAGYELFFSHAAAGGGVDAAALCAAFADLQLAQALSGVHAFIAADPALLAAPLLDTLPADLVVIQISARDLALPAVRERAQTLRAAGFALCIADIDTGTPLDDEALALANYCKFDLHTLAPDALQALAFALRAPGRTLIARGVDNSEQMSLCALLGVSLFQGYFFAQVRLDAQRRFDPSIQAIFRLIGQLAAEAEVDELEASLRGEPALVVDLLRLSNSAARGARVSIRSIRHAISVLGRRQIARWLQLLLFRGKENGCCADNALMHYAALRGRFMEILAARAFPANPRLPDPAFLTGLLSVLPAALGATMEDILGELPVEDQVRLALLRHEGDIGALLALLDAYDANDRALLVQRLGDFPALPPQTLGQVLSEAMNWVRSLDVAA